MECIYQDADKMPAMSITCCFDPLPCARPHAPGLQRPVGGQREPNGDGTGSPGIAFAAGLSSTKQDRSAIGS